MFQDIEWWGEKYETSRTRETDAPHLSTGTYMPEETGRMNRGWARMERVGIKWDHGTAVKPENQESIGLDDSIASQLEHVQYVSQTSHSYCFHCGNKHCWDNTDSHRSTENHIVLAVYCMAAKSCKVIEWKIKLLSEIVVFEWFPGLGLLRCSVACFVVS